MFINLQSNNWDCQVEATQILMTIHSCSNRPLLCVRLTALNFINFFVPLILKPDSIQDHKNSKYKHPQLMMNVCQIVSDTPRVMTILETRRLTFTHVLQLIVSSFARFIRGQFTHFDKGLGLTACTYFRHLRYEPFQCLKMNVLFEQIGGFPGYYLKFLT